ncbi:MAG: hypothetical protein GY855_00915 [candidate division Zixibacteria bacterium]|nr:hypothetical protein [candidate division Zixibacteria bacterium]
MKTVGYFEGTNPEVLSQLMLSGYETIPLSNGWDNHGKNITHITSADKISLIVGYIHKFIPVSQIHSMADLLSPMKVNKIPVIFIAPKAMHDKARKLLVGRGLKYTLADPGKFSESVLSALSGRKSKKAIKKTKKKRK